MTSFRDKTGKAHFVELTVGSARKVKAATGVNLIDPTAISDGKTAFEALAGNVELIVDALFLLSGESDPVEFASCFDGGTIERAVDALVGEIINFSRPPMRTLLERTWEALRQTRDEAEKAAKKVSVAEIKSALKNYATASRGSSESTQTR